MSRIGEVKILEKEKEFEVEWKCPDLDYLSLKECLSPTFSFADVSWYLGMYPNGRLERSTVYIDMFICCGGVGFGSSSRLQYSLALKTVNGQKDLERQKTEIIYGGNRHLIDRLLSRSEYRRRKTEFLVSGFFTVICSLQLFNAGLRPINTLKQTRILPGTLRTSGFCTGFALPQCAYCENYLVDGRENHEERCMDRPIKCPACSNLVKLKNWLNGHECHPIKTTEACSYCKHNIDTENISAHDKKCMNRPIKCPECSKVVLLQNWHEHECGASEAEGVRTLRRDLKKALLSGTNHNLILKVGKKEIRAHRDILKARSRVFESMLNHDMVEKNSGVIDATDCDPEAMEQFLLYVYCGKVEKLDETIMLALYYIADKYEMEDLKQECSEFIQHSLSPSNFSKVIQLAINHSDSSLLDCATEYFTHNLLDIFRTVEWQSFLKDNSTVANELLIKSQEKRK